MQSAQMTRTSLVLRMMVPHLGQTHRRVLLLAFGGLGAPVSLLPGALLPFPVPTISSHASRSPIWKSIQDAIQNFSEDEYDKLRYEFEKLVFETFVEEARKSKKPLPDKKNNEEPPKEDADVNECICQSLL